MNGKGFGRDAVQAAFAVQRREDMVRQGSIFPNFEYVSYDGNRKELYSQIEQSPAAVLFLRYIGCTKCRLDLHELLASEAMIRKKGLRVFVVFQSEPQTVRQEVGQFPFEIICDPEQQLYRRFEVAAAQTREELLALDHFGREHEAFQKAKVALGLTHGAYEGNELQKPAIFVLDADKKVVFAHYAGSLMDMPPMGQWIGLFPDL